MTNPNSTENLEVTNSTQQAQQRVPWYKLINSLSVSFSVVVIPIVIAVLGNQHTESENLAKQRSEYIKMGLNILNSAPTEENKELRKWAVELINHYSDVKMKSEAESELINKITLPFFSNTFAGSNGINNINHQFNWVGDENSAYSFEVQELQNGEWKGLTGVSVKGTSFSTDIPVNTQLRWRASKYRPDGSIDYTNWLKLLVAK